MILRVSLYIFLIFNTRILTMPHSFEVRVRAKQGILNPSLQRH
ncbi:unnamed protein product [Amoebophrya sp. A25]|nr:unnamed protein product [Amoebophrya sp. A25]|eukprot:GSA25T00004432001.1